MSLANQSSVSIVGAVGQQSSLYLLMQQVSQLLQSTTPNYAEAGPVSGVDLRRISTQPGSVAGVSLRNMPAKMGPVAGTDLRKLNTNPGTVAGVDFRNLQFGGGGTISGTDLRTINTMSGLKKGLG
jgi:hypothetical protein